MAYEDLFALIRGSGSTARYFFGLPVEMQLAISEHRYSIRTAAELRQMVYRLENFHHAIAVSESFDGLFGSEANK